MDKYCTYKQTLEIAMLSHHFDYTEFHLIKLMQYFIESIHFVYAKTSLEPLYLQSTVTS